MRHSNHNETDEQPSPDSISLSTIKKALKICRMNAAYDLANSYTEESAEARQLKEDLHYIIQALGYLECIPNDENRVLFSGSIKY